ncbi:two-component system, NarL family, response regulator DegU [Dehalogenimonas formicexedens]|uniref:Two-component system, NarL family, response regulator DegU n=1 Tax=Dehalogenimonas formicexedens TaxID=1839801 RepID=A0A1P8F8J7_9CHLR|nr:response regulator transcription factor [Dehalogenimonas formicexedens]APV44753.1 two-component system, NarL family, response regulator DegU [Dehalogenimonas formicexedens]
MTTIILADDHKIVRQGVRALLEYEPDFNIVGEAGSGTEALSMLESTIPDVLVTDLSMPGLTGIELASEIRKRNWPTKVIILSMHGDEPYVARALASGASGYILKESGVEHTVNAIREALAGGLYVSPPLIMPSVN